MVKKFIGIALAVVFSFGMISTSSADISTADMKELALVIQEAQKNGMSDKAIVEELAQADVLGAVMGSLADPSIWATALALYALSHVIPFVINGIDAHGGRKVAQAVVNNTAGKICPGMRIADRAKPVSAKAE